MRTRSSRARAIRSASAASSPFTFLGASVMFCSTVMWGKWLKDWKTIPTSVRSFTRFTRGPVMGSPWTRISPPCTGSSRFTQRMSVLLPEPEGPHTTMTSPASTVRSTSVSTWCDPNHLLTPLNSMAGGMLLDHHQHVARIDRLARLDPDLLHGAGHRRLELVLHLHGLEHDEAVARRHRLTDRDLDHRDLARHRCLEHLAPGARGRAAGADEVARLLLDPDRVALARDVDRVARLLLGDGGHVGGAVQQDR